MAKRKAIDATETVPDTTPPEGQNAGPIQEPRVNSDKQAVEQPKKSNWVARFGIFGDYEAGVRLIEDRKNRRMTIQFQEKPFEAVRAVLKSEEHGYRFDSEDHLWYKRINQAKPAQSRKEADELVYQLADMLRAEKGLPRRQASSLAH